MKILSYLVIALVLCNLLYSFTLSLNTTRNISAYNLSANDFQKKNTSNGIIYRDGKIKVKVGNISEFLFLNNSSGNTSFTTVTLGLIIFALVILLLFGPDSIRFKIYQSHCVLFLVGLLICSAVISWYFTKSFVDSINNGLGGYTYQFNYGSALWLFILSLSTVDIVRRFKQKADEHTLQAELDKLSQQ